MKPNIISGIYLLVFKIDSKEPRSIYSSTILTEPSLKNAPLYLTIFSLWHVIKVFISQVRYFLKIGSSIRCIF